VPTRDAGLGHVALGSPLFTAIASIWANGKTITETAPAPPTTHPTSLDGSTWSGAYLPADLFSDGGSLDWTLGPAPDTTWGAAAGDAPPSNTAGLLPALGYETGGDPVVAAGSSATVTLGVQSMSGAGQQIDWTDSAPTGSGIAVGPPHRVPDGAERGEGHPARHHPGAVDHDRG
jgi:hypothetical protein